MTTLLIAIVSASFLGSLHCVGMCGPFAIWATGSQRSMGNLIAYHLGRLATYLFAGGLAGVVGSGLTWGGQLAGWQMMGARVAGAALIIVGGWQLVKIMGLHRSRRRSGDALVPSASKPSASKPSASGPSAAIRFLQTLRPVIASMPPIRRAFVGGLLTTWLPCGWLYLFILIAAGTGTIVHALSVMAAFWVGSLPALTGLVLGIHRVTPRIRTAVPILTAMMLIITGGYTATGRAAADLSAMSLPVGAGSADDSLLETVQTASQTPMPCCPKCLERKR